MKDTSKKLIIGIGNTGRKDDGLGWMFLDLLKESKLKGWDMVYKYQLNIEDADLVKDVETLIFVDSYNDKLPKGFLMEECHSRLDFEYTTHALNPCSVLALCNNLYKKRPTTFVMKIQGFEWGLGEGLSERAMVNLKKAVDYFSRKYAQLDHV